MEFESKHNQETLSQGQLYTNSESYYNTTDQLLEDEKQNNQKDNWNKLDKTTKLHILTIYADNYGAEKEMSKEDIAELKRFFRDAIEKGKFQKAKDVVYDKANRIIKEIPSLHWNNVTNNFTLRNLDSKKVSILKSLTPKRLTAKNIATTNKHSAAKLCIEQDNETETNADEAK